MKDEEKIMAQILQEKVIATLLHIHDKLALGELMTGKDWVVYRAALRNAESFERMFNLSMM